MDLESIMLSEISQLDRERQTPYNFTYMLNLMNKINEQAEQKQTHRHRKHFDGSQLEELVKKVKELRGTNW